MLEPTYCHAHHETGAYPEDIIKDERSDFIIAVEGHAVIGFLHIQQMQTADFSSIVPHNYAQIMALMVTSSKRRQGIGTQLLKAAMKWSRTRQLDYVELVSWANARETARFYDWNGYAAVSHIRRYTLS